MCSKSFSHTRATILQNVVEQNDSITLSQNLDLAECTEKHKQELYFACNSSDLQSITNHFKRFTPQTKKNGRFVRNQEGQVALSLRQEQQFFDDYFAVLFDALRMSFSQLLLSDQQHLIEKVQSCTLSIQWHVFPSFQRLKVFLVITKAFRAIGMSLIGGEIYKYAAHQISMLLLPLLLKVFVFGHSPLQWRGGRLLSLYKGKGDPQALRSHRDIMLTDTDSKAFQRFLRQSFFPHAQRVSRVFQVGSGLNSGSTEFARLILDSVIMYAREHALCMSALFVDIVCAFVSFYRGIFFRTTENVDRFRNHLLFFRSVFRSGK